METLDVNDILIDTYLQMLNNLSIENKLELISKLTHSMKKEKKDESVFFNLFGAWKDDQSAKSLISEIRGARNFNRTRLEF